MSGRAPFTGKRPFGRVFGSAQRWGVVIGGSYSRRRYESELFRGADGAWGDFNGFFGAAERGVLALRRQPAAAGRQRAVGIGPRSGSASRSASTTTCSRTPKGGSRPSST